MKPPRTAEREKKQQKLANWLDFFTENPPHLMVDYDFRSYLILMELGGHSHVFLSPNFLFHQRSKSRVSETLSIVM